MLLRLWIITKRTFLGFASDNCTQQAAAITYYVLFALVPLTIVVIAVLGAFLDSDDVTENIVDWVLEIVPLSDFEGRASVTEVVTSIQNLSRTFAIFGLFLAIWGSLAVFAAIRRALNNVWGIEEERPWIQAKFVDLVQVGVVSAVLLGSIVLTGLIRAARNVSGDYLGPLARGSTLWEVPTALLPAAMTFVAFTLLYRIVPASRPDWRNVLPGAAVAALLFEALKLSFAIYITNFNQYDVVYGSLGGLMLFLFYMFLGSNILLLGAELVETLDRFHAGAFEHEINPPEPLPPVPVRMYRAFRGLFVRS